MAHIYPKLTLITFKHDGTCYSFLNQAKNQREARLVYSYPIESIKLYVKKTLYKELSSEEQIAIEKDYVNFSCTAVHTLQSGIKHGVPTTSIVMK